MNLTGKHKEIQGMRRVAALAVCAALGLATCASALALGMHVNTSPAAGDSNPSKPPTQLSVPAHVMQGNLLNKVVPVYPEAAKKARIQGTVVLSAVISKNGNVANLRIISENLRAASAEVSRDPSKIIFSKPPKPSKVMDPELPASAGETELPALASTTAPGHPEHRGRSASRASGRA